ncbi:MAG: chalcone isomerase family protein, partial [Bacteroidota bacterium]
EGEDFMHAWLRIWLGKEPADGGLKQDLLGGD